MINVQESFRKWFSPKKPKSYKNWDTRLDEIKEAYMASFGNNVFEINENIEISINEIKENIEKRQEVDNKTFAEFNRRMSNGIPQAILSTWLITFLRDYSYINETENMDNEIIVNKNENIDIKNNFSLEKDLENSLISQYEELFPEYKIYGENGEGIQYIIGGKRIDLLLEHKTKNQLLVIELKAGVARFDVFGQISMYLGLLMEKFSDKTINGVIIASEIDQSLIKAAITNKNVKLMEYKMELSLTEIGKGANGI